MSQSSKKGIKASDKEKYSHPIPDRDFILGVLKQHDKAMKREELAKVLELTGENELEALRRRLRAMERDGQVAFNGRYGYSPLSPEDMIEGRVIGHRDGFGFLARDEGGDDLLLNNTQMLKLFDGDRIQVRISGVDRRGRQEATLIKILEHNTSQLVGCLNESEGNYYIQPANARIANEVSIPNELLMGATEGQYVVVNILDYPTHQYNARGEVIEILGDAMTPGLEIDVAIRAHEIPHLWPEEVLKAAESMGHEVKEADKSHRVDLRHLPFVTIDGEDARDFDDAVYCQQNPKGGWRLFVAIADVSHYVKPDSVLDVEAQLRGTSVYFPGHVVPMLPEVLSNGLCSLNPDVDRLVMVCEMSINASGKMTRYEFSEGLIHSHARLTYNQVNAALTEPESELGQKIQRQHKAILPDLKCLYTLYDALRVARTERGSIDFDTQEVQFQFCQQRKIEQINPVLRNDAHKIIEECMLCANVATARFLAKLKMPALYRVHTGPQPKKLASLREFLSEKGLQLAGGDKPTPNHYDNLLGSIGERKDAKVIQTMMLRSLSQAAYSPDNDGHFGLAYNAYAHFTSPIRRYPDLLVHRAIRSVIRRGESGGALRRALKALTGIGNDPVQRVKTASLLEPSNSYPYNNESIASLAEHCSTLSRRADKASWDVEAWLKCEFMQDSIGEVFTGTINSVTGFGLFIELKDTQIEGLIHITALKDDFYHFDAAKQQLVGENNGSAYAMGDIVDVRVVRVDMEQRKIEFELAEQQEQHKSTKKKPKKSKAKGH